MVSDGRLKEKFSIYTIGKYGYIAVLLLLLVALAASKFSGPVSDLLLVICEEGLLACAICSLLARKLFSIKGSLQMSAVFFLLTVFWVYTLYKSIRHQTAFNVITACIGAVALGGSLIIWLIILFKDRAGEIWNGFQTAVKQNLHVILVSVFFFALYLDCFNYLFKSDSEIYYNTIAQNTGLWDFTLRDLSVFQIGYHSSFGYSLFVFPGYYLIRINGIGVRIVNYLMTVATLFCLNGIISALYPRMGKMVKTMLLFLFVCNPLIAGLAQEINMDMVMTCFFVWFVWAFIRKHTVFVPFFAILLCFTKENGILLLVGFMAGIFLFRLITDWIKNGFSLRRVDKLLNLHEWLVLYAAVLFVLCFILYNNWHSGSAGQAAEDGAKLLVVNTIGINKPYILIKLKQVFILNFQWLAAIPAGLLIIGLICGAKKFIIREETLALLGAFGCFLMFQLFYITYPHYRYLVPNTFFLTILTAFTLYELEWKRMQPVIPAAISIAFLIQSFINIDPITKRLSRFAPTGNGEILSEAYFASDPRGTGGILYEDEGGDLSSEVFRDYVQNNRQYLGFERCFESFLKEINYTSDMGILISPIFDDTYWGSDVWTTVNMFGLFERERLYWNEEKGQLSYNENDIPICWINTDDEGMKSGFRQCRQVWYVELPYRIDWDYEGFIKPFQIAETKEIVNGQWSFTAYRLLLTESAGERLDMVRFLAKENISADGKVTAFVSSSERKNWTREEENLADRITFYHIARSAELEELCSDLPEMILVQNNQEKSDYSFFQRIEKKLNQLSDIYQYSRIEKMKTENGVIGVWIREIREK